MGLGELLRDSPEQFAVFQAAGKHQSIVVEALAGTGKTTTLVACGEKLTLENKKVLYLAFNREIVKETKGKAKALFDCYTAHGLAFKHMSPSIAEKFAVTDGQFLKDQEIAKYLSIPRSITFIDFEFRMESEEYFNSVTEWETYREKIEKLGEKRKALSRSLLVDLVLSIYSSFVKSDVKSIDIEFVEQHIFEALGWPWANAGFCDSKMLLSFIQEKSWDFWERTIDVENLDFPLGHDVYLKLWQLTNPKLEYDAILFDEAQDADPVMLDIIQRQSAQVIWCGDSQQQIYGWRGAMNTMKVVERNCEFTISTTRRFGTPIDQIANAFLVPLNSEMIRANPDRASEVRFLGLDELRNPEPTELELFRRNVPLLLRFISLVDNGFDVHVLADLEQLEKLIQALIDLANERQPLMRSIARFDTFGDLVDFVNLQISRRDKNKYSNTPQWFPDVVALFGLEVLSKNGRFVWTKLSPNFGNRWEKLLMAIGKARTSKSSAKITLATAHRAKGLTAGNVLVHGDFLDRSIYSTERSVKEAWEYVRQIEEGLSFEQIQEIEEEIRLCYVAVTRARNLLIHPFIIKDLEDLVHTVKHPVTTISLVKDEIPEATMPVWADVAKVALTAVGIAISQVQVLDFRVRFSGWKDNDGSIERVEVDIIMNKEDFPTVVQVRSSEGSSLVAVVENALNPLVKSFSKSHPKLPDLTARAIRHLENVKLFCDSIDWENGPHQWQVSIWDKKKPENLITISFGKKGLNVLHLGKCSGNEVLCNALWEMIQMGVKEYDRG